MSSQRRMLLIFAVCLIAALGVVGYYITRTPKEITLTLATGSPGGTYHAMGKGLKAAIERHVPTLNVELLETGGSEENMQLVSSKNADLAFVQGSTQSAPHVKSIANLYAEVLQIVVPSDSPVSSIRDFEGRTIGVGARGGGTHRVSELVLRHYGVAPGEYTAEHMGFRSAIEALEARKLDGAFLMAGIPTEALQDAAGSGAFRMVPVDHGPALVARHPFFRTSTIPQGLYSGAPPFPQQDVPSVSVSAVLVASDHLDPDVVRDVTAALFHETSRIVTAGHIRGADIDETFAQHRPVFPLHSGAQDYYHRKEPPISADFSEFLGMVFSLLIPLVGMIWAVLRWITQRKKDRIDEYYKRLHSFFERAHASESEEDVARIERELIELKDSAFRELIDEKLLANDAFLIFQREFSFCFEYVIAKRRIMHQGG